MEEITLRRKLITWAVCAVVLAGVGFAAQWRHLDEVPRDAVDLDVVLKTANDFAARGTPGTIDELASAMQQAGIFKGGGQLSATVTPKGRMVFFHDRNSDKTWDRGYENDIFVLEVEHATNRLIASDKYGNHRYLVMTQKVADNWLTRPMLRNQHAHHGRYFVFGYYYSPHGYYGSYAWRRNVRVASVAHRGPGGHRFGK